MAQREPRVGSGAAFGRQVVSAFVAAVVGIPVAAAVVPEFRIGGQFSEQIWLVGGIAVVMTILDRLTALLLSSGWPSWVRTGIGAGPGSVEAGSKVSLLRGVVGVAIILVKVFATVLSFVALWLSVRLGQLWGLPVELVGFWPTVLASVVMSVVGAVGGGAIVGLVRRDRRVPQVLGLPVVGGLVGVGLWLAVWALDGVDLEAGTGSEQLLTLLVLGCLFAVLGSPVGDTVPSTVATVAFTALKLWLLSWVSTGTELPLHIEGFWNFVWTALILTVVAVPTLLIPREQDPPSPPPYDPFPPDPFGHPTSGLPYGWTY